MNENIKGLIERNADILSSIFEFRLSGDGLVMDIDIQSKLYPFFEYFDFRDPTIYTYEFYACLIDYGVPFPTTGFELDSLTKPLMNHAYLSNSRVVSSRKALAALIICCKRGFFPLRDVGVALAREMWVQKGPSGCGPRGKEWLEEKG